MTRTYKLPKFTASPFNNDEGGIERHSVNDAPFVDNEEMSILASQIMQKKECVNTFPSEMEWTDIVSLVED